jgi:ATP-dependent RNA helicase DDX24/MAK5
VVAGDDEEQAQGGDGSESEVRGLQTFVFSATMSKDLQRNVKKRSRPKLSKKGTKPASTLDELLLRLDFRDSDPAIIDLSPADGVVSTLKESKLLCLSADKVS